MMKISMSDGRYYTAPLTEKDANEMGLKETLENGHFLTLQFENGNTVILMISKIVSVEFYNGEPVHGRCKHVS